MNRWLKKIFALLSLSLLLTTGAQAYTATTFDDVVSFAVANPAIFDTDSNSVLLNGITLSWAPNPSAASETIFYADGTPFAVLPGTTRFYTLQYTDQTAAILEQFAQIFSLSLISSAYSLSVPTSSSLKSALLFFNQVVMPMVKAKSAQLLGSTRLGISASLGGGALRYEEVERSKVDGTVTGMNIGIVQDLSEDFSIGAIIPYDRLDYDYLFDADRFGLILYAKQNIALNDRLSLGLSGNFNSIYTDINFAVGGGDSVSSYGGGAGISLSYDLETVVSSLAAFYQYSKDDTGFKDDHQHLLKLGANTGFRFGESHVATLYAIYNRDVTDYHNEPSDRDYFDLGIEASFGLSETWGFTFGYKRVTELDNYQSDEIYLGSAISF